MNKSIEKLWDMRHVGNALLDPYDHDIVGEDKHRIAALAVVDNLRSRAGFSVFGDLAPETKRDLIASLAQTIQIVMEA